MKKLVMICDDDLDILELCRYILERQNYEVQTFSSYESMRTIMDKKLPDLLLIDLWMPGIGGEEATKMIKADPKMKHLPVLLFSANNEIEQIATQVKAAGFIRKPFDTKELLGIIEKSIRQAAL